MYLYLVFNKTACRALLYIDIILFVKTNDIRPDTGYKKGRISGTTLQKIIADIRPHISGWPHIGPCWILFGNKPDLQKG